MSKVAIVGGGAAGMMAAVFAARNGHEVHLFEKNEKLGKKLYITGKGRCNLTNACDIEELFFNVRKNAKFLYSAFYSFSNEETIRMFEELGLKTKTERGNRVFPVSDHSSDVIAVLAKELNRLHVNIHLHTEVERIEAENGCIVGIQTKQGRQEADAVILATGGVSYPATGSTGDGYRFAKETGHKITPLSPSLVPFLIKEDYVKQLQGLSLKNVQVSIGEGKKQLYSDFGEMLFTHFGVSGPLILSASTYISPYPEGKELPLYVDLKPALSEKQLDNRILREFDGAQNKQFKNAVAGLFPSKLLPVMISLSGIAEEKKVHEITREEREAFVRLIKHMPMTITGLRDFKEAIITRGGVQVKDVQPSTMESKYVKNLYFAGEVLDVDAMTGGFNLQIAWSTAYLAGNSIK